MVTRMCVVANSKRQPTLQLSVPAEEDCSMEMKWRVTLLITQDVSIKVVEMVNHINSFSASHFQALLGPYHIKKHKDISGIECLDSKKKQQQKTSLVLNELNSDLWIL